MLKKDIKYEDFDGNEREETFYFNLTKAEVTEMELGLAGGLTGLIKKIVAEKDNQKILEIFKEIILKSYGEKSADGRYFVKNDQIREKFISTQAFSELYVELTSSAEAASAFMNGILPRDMQPVPN